MSAYTMGGTLEDQSRWDARAGVLNFQTRHFALVDAAAIERGMRVLDIGCGRGEVAVLAARRGAQVEATDIGPRLIEAAERNAANEHLSIRTFRADMRDLPADSGPFDLVLGASVLHHLDERGLQRAVRSALRVLAPGGRALFLEPTDNVTWFRFLKYCFPGRYGRPSLINRPAWRRYLRERDDRPLTDRELLEAAPAARIVGRVGLIERFFTSPYVVRFDVWLLRTFRWLGPYAIGTIIEYRKSAVEAGAGAKSAAD